MSENKRRSLIVIENKQTGERFLYNPLKGKHVVPEGYYKITQTIPLDEKKFGHLPVLD